MAAMLFLVLLAGSRIDASSLWADEAFSLATVLDFRSSVTASNYAMVGYYAPLWAWAKLGTSTAWLRAFSLLCMLGVLPLMQAIARRVGGVRLAVVVPLVMVTNPMVLWMAITARSYALEMLVAALCWYALIRMFEPGVRSQVRLRFTIVLVAGGILGPLLHGLFIVQMIAMAAWAAIGRERRERMRFVGPAVVGSLVVTLVLWLGGLDSSGAVHPAGLAEVVRRWYVSSDQIVGWIGVAIGLIGMWACASANGRRLSGVAGRYAYLVPTWVVVTFAMYVVVREGHGVWTPYYPAPTAPAVSLLLAIGLVAVFAWFERTVWKRSDPHWGVRPWLGMIGVIVVLGGSLVARPPGWGEDWRGAASEVARNVEPGDGILFDTGTVDDPAQTRPPFEAAWREVHHPVIPSAISPNRPLGEVRRLESYLSQEQVLAAVGDFGRVWVIDYHGVLARGGLLSRPPFDTELHREQLVEFDGGITVILYTRDPRSMAQR